VKEASRLLSNSILKVEKPQLDIETEQEEVVENQEDLREGGARTNIIVRIFNVFFKEMIIFLARGIENEER
jgi:hypothetical protein